MMHTTEEKFNIIKNYWLVIYLQTLMSLLSLVSQSSDSPVHSPPHHWSPDLMLAVVQWVAAAF